MTINEVILNNNQKMNMKDEVLKYGKKLKKIVFRHDELDIKY